MTASLPCDFHAVSIKLAPFFTEDPQGRFTQAEVQFRIRNASVDERKYWYVCAALDAETSSRVTRVTCKAEPGKKYGTVKAFLLNFSLSQWD